MCGILDGILIFISRGGCRPPGPPATLGAAAPRTPTRAAEGLHGILWFSSDFVWSSCGFPVPKGLENHKITTQNRKETTKKPHRPSTALFFRVPLPLQPRAHPSRGQSGRITGAFDFVTPSNLLSMPALASQVCLACAPIQSGREEPVRETRL